MTLDPLVEARTTMVKPVFKPTLSDGQLAQLEHDVKRRGGQAGTLLKRGKRWYGKFSRHTFDEAGNIVYKQTMRVIPGENLTRTQALAGLRDLVAEANALAAAPKQMASFRQFTESYWWAERKDRWRPSTRAFYRFLLDRHVLPSIGVLPLRDVSPAIVQTLLDSKSKRLSKRTVVGIRDTITAVYRYARRKGFWAGDIPSEGAEAGGTEAVIQKSLTPTEADLVIAHMDPLYKPLTVLVRHTGLRIGEALGLRWKWVNFALEAVAIDGILVPPQCIAVVQAFSRGQWGKPKTAASRRIIPLVGPSLAALKEMRERDIAGTDDDPVFRASTGNPWDAHHLAARNLKPAARKAGVPWAHWHTFRHSLELDIETKRKVLGHSSVATSRIYDHPDIEQTRAKLVQ